MEASKINRWWILSTPRSRDLQAQSMISRRFSLKAYPSKEVCSALPLQCTNLSQIWQVQCWPTQFQGQQLLAIQVPVHSPVSKVQVSNIRDPRISHPTYRSRQPLSLALNLIHLSWWARHHLNSPVASTLFNSSNTITNSKYFSTNDDNCYRMNNQQNQNNGYWVTSINSLYK